MIRGFKIGHWTDTENKTGTTVVLCEEGAVGGVDVRGGAPGTRETDLMKGANAVEKINAVVLSGGSAFGLEACDGVMQFLFERKKGFLAGKNVVPIVCGAVIFDLEFGKFAFPDKKAGYNACEVAGEIVETGNVGGGTGATIGKVLGLSNASKGGVGYFEQDFKDFSMACVSVVNAFGDVFDSEDNCKIVAGAMTGNEFANTSKFLLHNVLKENLKGQNTTICCLITDAKLNREQANKLASIAQNGLALSISPVHTMLDGDSVFALSSNSKDANFDAVCFAAVEIVRKSVLSSVEKRK